MSSSKLDTSGVFDDLSVESSKTALSLSPGEVKIHKGGIEFRSAKALAPWKEIMVEMKPPGQSRKVRFTGVIVACAGDRHAGYHVSMVITNVSRQSQVQLHSLAGARWE